MVDLKEVAKALREMAVLEARVAAARAARSRTFEVRAPYAVPRPICPNRAARLEQPDLRSAMDLPTRHVADNPAYHQSVEVDGTIVSYSHECAEWAPAKEVKECVKGPVTGPLKRTVNAGRAAQVLAHDTVSPDRAPRPAAVRPLPLKLVKRCGPAPNAGRGAEMLVTARPVAEPRPAFRRRPASAYALARSMTLIQCIRDLRDALRGSDPALTAARRRHLDEARATLGAKHFTLLSERLS